MVPYHGLPTGGPRQDAARFLAGRHALVPFQRPDDLGVALEVCRGVILDNGAYSVWKSGRTLDVEGYHSWVGDLRHHPALDFAIIPDVIDGDERANDALVDRWPWGEYLGVPVWHLHEALGRLARLACGFPRVAIGGSPRWPTPGAAGWWLRVDEAMRALDVGGGKVRCKLHGLRLLDPGIFTKLPLASADSTNAVRNANLVSRFGMYPPPNLWQRMAAIADRIEAHQSPAGWRGAPRQPGLFDEEEVA